MPDSQQRIEWDARTAPPQTLDLSDSEPPEAPGRVIAFPTLAERSQDASEQPRRAVVRAHIGGRVIA
jgi:hypothetical protein